ncbi:MAG: hypothetical protein QOJ73_592 [Streptosporangiaceae bacterium]|jgi:hypothetical protein|nr:hypothetical protein [Streptosporangiaceae bacterium]
MTLAMMLVRPEGIWQSADHRVTKAGVRQPDASKQLAIHCRPTPGGGPKILLAFTGRAEMPDGTPTLQWIRETIRGESRFIMPLLEHLRDRLTRDVGKSSGWQAPLVMIGGILEANGRRGLLQIANVDPSWHPRREFKLLVTEITEPKFMAIGSGQPHITREDAKLAVAQSKIRPARWEDHLGLLAKVNRRTAERARNTVSPWCEVTYLKTGDEAAIGRYFREPGDPPVPIEVNVMLDGIDLSEMVRPMLKNGRFAGWPKEEEERATRRTVEGRP